MTRRQKGILVGLSISVVIIFTCLVCLTLYYLVLEPGATGNWLVATEPSASQGKIVFSQWVSDDLAHEIYVMNADGTGLMNLTNHPSDDTEPSCSPEGRRIAFVSYRDGNDDIYIINTDGSGLFQVTHTSGEVGCGSPSWSPDAKRIAFESYLEDPGDDHIYVVNADGTGLHKLTTNAEWDRQPAWSPDGQRIAFESPRGENITDLYLINTDGTGLVQLTDTPHNWDRAPAWSPDGTRIAFTRMSGWPHGWQDADIYVVNVDGSGLTQVTTGSDWDFSPSWSPDGGRLALSFHADDSLTYYISLVNLDGTSRMSFSRLPESHTPAWCSDVHLSTNQFDDETQPDELAYNEYMDCTGEVMRRANEDVALQIELALGLLANDFIDTRGFCDELPTWSSQIAELKATHSDCAVPQNEYLQEHWRLRDKSLQEHDLTIECCEGYCPSLTQSQIQECTEHLDRALEYSTEADAVMREYLSAPGQQQ